MTGLVPVIHVVVAARKTWMRGTKPAHNAYERPGAAIARRSGVGKGAARDVIAIVAASIGEVAGPNVAAVVATGIGPTVRGVDAANAAGVGKVPNRGD